ncbi:capsule biosynthesis protein [Sphingomonas sp. Leaf33]|uniref:ABC transporter permease n=1 Tax=Sphingomonas sp. Leaf33 TaxID=1736215 RepID=UPI0007020463|nr:ABC transporter permease [Sphingomonas sp. Leaf33]KQN21235.1 capsule biosynthesis protein [Sphingomonas sp. Leaf33]
MPSLQAGWRIQTRVIRALMTRELITRFGRENIGFLWMMVEPLLFALLVGIMWTILGNSEHGLNVIAFVITGYLPLTLFRHAVGRSVKAFSVNGSLMYHRQIKMLDFIVVRFLIEMIGGMMAYVFIAVVLIALDLFPVPANILYVILGWLLYCLFTFSLCLILAPLSEVSEVLEKFIPVTTYIMIPFSGTFNMMSWLSPQLRDILYWSPPVNAMEMMRYGIFGDQVTPYYDPMVPIVVSLALLPIGLAMCRRIRKTLVVE